MGKERSIVGVVSKLSIVAFIVVSLLVALFVGSGDCRSPLPDEGAGFHRGDW